ncbi:N,N-dimethylformamidase beta subunit family domain-containing protein [Streptosporangium sp. NPDC051023]|uniref:N,N-dimethylformamidase beta subunit family domain-containing protein n=1 Tax=Streptosporangium sp. NPDC051023 TaxID=3155410 RepID=UPI00344D81CB
MFRAFTHLATTVALAAAVAGCAPATGTVGDTVGDKVGDALRGVGRSSGPAVAAPSPASSPTPGTSQAPAEGTGPTAGPETAENVTVAENAKQGDPLWRANHQGGEHEIEGFADRVSVLPGEAFHLRVSTTADRYTATAFRMGWYGGAGARKVWESEKLPGTKQAPPRTIAATRTVTAAHWKPGPAVDTTGWPEGSYLIRLEATTGARRFVPLTVRSASTEGRLVVVNGVTTWQAYNLWGGRSLYLGPGGFEDRSTAVSFDRPYDTSGARLFLDLERAAIEVAEHSGVPLAYITNLELESDPHILDGARGLVSLGHDEYWSVRMRRTVEAARGRGVNLAFLGANAVYWRIRFASTPLGPNRLVVCHKDGRLDPSTDRWRVSEPESSLTGPMYNCFPAEAAYVVHSPDSWIFEGTGVRRGTSFPGLAGVETDEVLSGMPLPRPMEVLSVSPVDCSGRPTTAHSAYYTAPSGAGVFSTGTMRWVCAMRGSDCGHGVTDRTALFVRAATMNVLRAFATGPAGREHPARDNLASLGLGSPRRVIPGDRLQGRSSGHVRSRAGRHAWNRPAGHHRDRAARGRRW